MKIESNKERMKWCRKLYGDVIFVGRVFKSGNPQRRYFVIKFANGYTGVKCYARHLKEKEIGYKLPPHIHVHHKDEHTLNDSLGNLLRKCNSNHVRYHGKNKEPMSEEQKFRLSMAMCGRGKSQRAKMKMRSGYIKYWKSKSNSINQKSLLFSR